ncbi:unnamed protein product, partial [Owenia fusiformis]
MMNFQACLNKITTLKLCRCHLVQSQQVATIMSDALPRITVPHKMVERLEKMKQKQQETMKKKSVKKDNPIIISCKRKQFNHYKGQLYTNWSPQSLTSHGWKNKRNKGDYFTINAFQSNPAFRNKTEDGMTFKNMELDDSIQQGLGDMGLEYPTNIQEMSIPKILSGSNVLCAAETGCGKTLAYLVPIAHHLKRYIDRYGRHGTPNKPCSVIITPSRELADQIYDVACRLTAHTGLLVHSVCGGRGTKKLIYGNNEKLMDILIATPDVLRKLTGSKQYDVSGVHHIVLDEGDSLLDDSFIDVTRTLLNRLKVQGDSITNIGSESDLALPCGQVCIVGATLPRALNDTIGDVIPVDTLEVVRTNSLHRIMPHISQKFIRLGPSEKPVWLVKQAKSAVKNKIPTLIFCNKTDTSYFVHHILRDSGIETNIINGKVPEKIRQGKFEEFQRGEGPNILVCTDIASRGLDT